MDALSEQVKIGDFAQVSALLTILDLDPDTDRRIFDEFLIYRHKVKARVAVEQCVEIMKEHASHVIAEGLAELEHRKIML